MNDIIEIAKRKNHNESRNKVLLQLQQIYMKNLYRLSSKSDSSMHNSREREGEPQSPVVEDLLMEMNPNRLKKFDENNSANCYRCKHFLNTPQSVSEHCEKISNITEAYEGDLTFVQAIVWLKSATLLMKDISIEQFHLVFHKQWNDHRDKRNAIEHFIQNSVSKSVECDSESPRTIIVFNDEKNNTVVDNDFEYIGSNECNAKSNATRGTVEADLQQFVKQSEKVFATGKNNSLFVCSSQTRQRYVSRWVENNVTMKSYDVPDTNKEYTSNSDVFEDSSEGSEISNMTWKKNSNKMLAENDLIIARLTEEIPQNSSSSSKNCVDTRRDFHVNASEESSSNSTDVTIFHKGSSTCRRTASNTPNNGNKQDSELHKQIATQCMPESDFNFHDKNAVCSYQINIPNSPQKDSMYDTYLSQASQEIDNIIPYRRATAIEKEKISDEDWQLRFSTPKISSHETCDEGIYSIKIGRTNHSVNAEREKTNEKKRKLESVHKRNDTLKENSKEEEEKISCRWLRFTLDALNIDDVAFQSVKVILSIFQNERITREYMRRRCWKNTLESQAVDVILNFCDVFEAENKTNVCTQEIVQTITNMLDDSIESTELNKAAVHIHQMTIILELCTSMNVCIKTINYLITKLQSFESVLVCPTNGKKINIYSIANKLNITFYALNVCLLKYRIIFNGKDDSEESTILPVVDLWKKQLISEGIMTEDNARARKRRWLMTLDEFTVMATENFTQFAEKSRRLVNILRGK